jgi:hypothetical protein
MEATIVLTRDSHWAAGLPLIIPTIPGILDYGTELGQKGRKLQDIGGEGKDSNLRCDLFAWQLLRAAALDHSATSPETVLHFL